MEVEHIGFHIYVEKGEDEINTNYYDRIKYICANIEACQDYDLLMRNSRIYSNYMHLGCYYPDNLLVQLKIIEPLEEENQDSLDGNKGQKENQESSDEEEAYFSDD